MGGYGYAYQGGTGFGLLQRVLVLQAVVEILIIIDLILLGAWLFKQFRKKK